MTSFTARRQMADMIYAFTVIGLVLLGVLSVISEHSTPNSGLAWLAIESAIAIPFMALARRVYGV